MNDQELAAKLRAVSVPERSEEYWKNFPQTVCAQLRPAPAARTARSASFLSRQFKKWTTSTSHPNPLPAEGRRDSRAGNAGGLNPVHGFNAQTSFRGVLSRMAWAGGLAYASLMVALLAGPVHTVLKTEKSVRHELAQLPNHLRTFMADEHGLHYLVMEKE
jgi:hypothetical protein